MNTGCLNWNEVTAIVATRPSARRAASTLPAMSTCAMIRPPKMSPCWLASAGMGTTRSTGSLFSGSLVTNRSHVTFRTGGSASKAVSDSAMRPVFSVQTGARIHGDPRDIEPEREGLALVRAQAQAEASELVFRAALRNIVVAARGVVEHERPYAPGAAEPRSEIRAVALEREPPADVARRFALVVAAHAVGAAHPELLAGDEQVFGLLGIRGRAHDEIR